MKLLKFAIISALIVGRFGVAQAEPKKKTVTLQKHTPLVVRIVPDLGTRFIFPFVLDEGDSDIPFTMVNTSEIFKTDRSPQRNSFVVMVERKNIPTQLQGKNLPDYVGNLLITVGDHMLSVELHTTKELEDHYADIFFEMGGLEEKLLIKNRIESRAKELDAEYEKRFDEIDRLAKEKVIHELGLLAIKEPKVEGIKREMKEPFEGEPVILYIDRALRYGPFISFVYEIENQGAGGLSVRDIKLIEENNDGVNSTIHTEQSLPPRLKSDELYEGVLSTRASKITSDDNRLMFEVTTDRGVITAKW